MIPIRRPDDRKRTTGAWLKALTTLLLAVPLGSCDSPTTALARTPGGTRLSVTPTVLILDNGTTGTFDASLADASGATIRARQLEWTSLQPGVATVSASGLVEAKHPGDATIRVAAPDHGVQMEVQVIVRPVADDVLFLVRNEFREGTAGAPLSDSLEVRVIDRGGLPVQGVAVSFGVESGSGVVSPAVVTTDVTGYARAQWTLGTEVGANVVAVFDQAAAAAAGPAGAAGQSSPRSKLHAWGRPGTPYSVTVSPTTDTIGVDDTNRLTAVVQDKFGNVLEGTLLEWTTSDGTVATVSTTGSVSGRAEGDATVTATVVPAASAPPAGAAPPKSSPSGSAAVRVRRSGPKSIARTSGNGQTGAVGEMLPEPLVVRVTKSDGSPIAGLDVSWSVSLGGGSLSATETTTDASGKTQINWTLGTRPGAQEVTAWAPGANAVVFSATAGIGEASQIVLTPSSLELEAGESQQMSATAYDQHGNKIKDRPVQWSTTNSAVAVVDVGGFVTGVSGGTASVKASLDGALSSASVTVTGGSSGGGAWTVFISPGTAKINALGDHVDLAATVADQSGGVVGGARVAWHSLNTEVANVDDFGRVTSHAVGLALIVATAATGAADTASVQSRQVVASVDVDPRNASVQSRKTAQFTAEAFDSLEAPISAANITWSTTDEAVAAVNQNGRVTAGQPGTATIVAKSGGITGWATIDVEPIPVASISVTPESVTLDQGASETVSLELRDAGGELIERNDVDWTTSDANVASVDNGTITGLAAGSAEITAAVDGKSATVQVYVRSSGTPPPPGGDVNNPFRAFPDAEGYGAMALTSCSRSNVEVLRVKNLNDGGAGSLRQAVLDATNGVLSVIVFDVAGIIYLDSAIELRSVDCLYVAGQTAPGGGITISTPSQVFYMKANTHDIAIRYLRLRGGYRGDRRGHSNVIIGAGSDIILDHLSASWTTDKPLMIYKSETTWSRPISRVSVQNSIVSEAFADQPTGMQITGQDNNGATEWRNVTDISIHRNLFAHNSHRNPNVNTMGTQLINNVIYNWRQGGIQTTKESKTDAINNYFKTGPMTHSSHEWEVTWDCKYHLGYTPSLHVVGNVGPNNTTGSGDQWSGSTRVLACYYNTGETIGQALPTSYRRNSPLPAPAVPVSTQGAIQSYDALMGHVGASSRLSCDGGWTGARDAVDTRVVNDAVNGTGSGSPPAHENDVGGFPNIASGSACADGDRDGMPDAFESRYDLNPGSAGDALQDADGDGYTNLEEYLNGTRPR